jgi:hypothetical protein
MMRSWVGLVELTSDPMGLPAVIQLLSDPKVFLLTLLPLVTRVGVQPSQRIYFGFSLHSLRALDQQGFGVPICVLISSPSVVGISEAVWGIACREADEFPSGNAHDHPETSPTESWTTLNNGFIWSPLCRKRSLYFVSCGHSSSVIVRTRSNTDGSRMQRNDSLTEDTFRPIMMKGRADSISRIINDSTSNDQEDSVRHSESDSVGSLPYSLQHSNSSKSNKGNRVPFSPSGQVAKGNRLSMWYVTPG